MLLSDITAGLVAKGMAERAARGSPGPWRLERRGGLPCCVWDADGVRVCDDEDYYPVAVREDDMELIVAAVNQYRWPGVGP